jgi:hypothetical protein
VERHFSIKKKEPAPENDAKAHFVTFSQAREKKKFKKNQILYNFYLTSGKSKQTICLYCTGKRNIPKLVAEKLRLITELINRHTI